jgi:hypothetical protein
MHNFTVEKSLNICSTSVIFKKFPYKTTFPNLVTLIQNATGEPDSESNIVFRSRAVSGLNNAGWGFFRAGVLIR